ncbi:hypothetical protein BD410DRAFT_810433 [Rickenella mellea]|uniref:Uncharacterized protein n=1 Tax=Rickenella mellea TaxID=50990 RepID=A0A4Y7PDY7_9AGAM|nr:hypothetical protein BD410DRAFT_810433 [Rickenella mellea]
MRFNVLARPPIVIDHTQHRNLLENISTTDGSSASSALFEQQPREETGSSAFAVQLKKLYRVLMNVKAKALKLHDWEVPNVSLRQPNRTQPDSEAEEQEKWSKFVAEHECVVALEHLQDYLYYAYKFYSMLLEKCSLDAFKSGWLEALSDLSRYRMEITLKSWNKSCLLKVF